MRSQEYIAFTAVLLCASVFASTTGSSTPVDETRINKFLEIAEYSRESILTAASNGACSANTNCCIQLLSPVPGYQGDNISVPRMAQAEASLTLEISGEDCIENSGESL